MKKRPLSELSRDAAGATITEFAMVAPVLAVLLLGLMDVSYNIYTASLLQGGIQKAGRDSTIEGAETRRDEIDERVRNIVRDIAPGSEIEFSRLVYVDYSDVGRAEDFTDLNGDGACNDGEPFADDNGNGSWDLDRGRDGMGGARDAVLYTVTVSYPRVFPLAGLIGLSDTVTTQARTVLRNQPYGAQNRPGGVGNCE